MSLLTSYLKNKRRKKLYAKLFSLRTSSAEFLSTYKTCKEAADNVRALIKAKDDVYLSCYLHEHNKQLQSFERTASIAYQKYLNTEEAIALIQKEIDSIL